MDPEEKVLLEKLVRLTEDNNEILHRMRKAAHWGMVWSFVKFLIIAAPLILGFLFLQDYFPQIREVINMISR